jgi:manganese transport protein
MSNIIAVIFQTLSARLGIVTGKDLAQACKSEYTKPVSIVLWIMSEIAIIACDLAEILGTILGLNLLFGLPLLWGALVAFFDTFLLLAIQRLGIRKMEAFIMSLITIIATGFIINLFLAKPDWGLAVKGLVPSVPEGSVYIILGIIGATVMPHNLYLHSSLVQTRRISSLVESKKKACRYNFLDSVVALNMAFIVNSAILILAASVFYKNGIVVTEIQQAYKLLESLMGTKVSSIAFGLALLASGQSSTITGTLAGQIVMEGFVNIRLKPHIRRLITRLLALVPAVIVIAIFGDKFIYKLLIFSQVVLSLQLPFAVVPLVHFTGDRAKMGLFVNKGWLKILAWLTSLVIIAFNGKLVYDNVVEILTGGYNLILAYFAVGIIGAISLFLFYLIIYPFIKMEKEKIHERIAEVSSIALNVDAAHSKHIVAALSRDKNDINIVNRAVRLAKLEKAVLTLVHVVDSPLVQIYDNEVYDSHTREDEQYLVEIAENIRSNGIGVGIALLYGDPAKELIDFVKNNKADMLIMSAQRNKLLNSLLLGQSVDPVMQKLDVPVLVV